LFLYADKIDRRLIREPLGCLGILIGCNGQVFDAVRNAWSECKGLADRCLALEQRNPPIMDFAEYEDLAVSRPATERGSLSTSPGLLPKSIRFARS